VGAAAASSAAVRTFFRRRRCSCHSCPATATVAWYATTAGNNTSQHLPKPAASSSCFRARMADAADRLSILHGRGLISREEARHLTEVLSDGLHRQRLYDAAMQRHAATRLVDLAGTFRSDEQLAHVLRSSALQVRAIAATGTVAGVADDDDVMMTSAVSQTAKSPVLAQESVISSWADIQRQETTGVVHHSTL
jgi:hypothetical protein